MVCGGGGAAYGNTADAGKRLVFGGGWMASGLGDAWRWCMARLSSKVRRRELGNGDLRNELTEGV